VRIAVLAAMASLAATAVPTVAQLRPLDPVDWRDLDDGTVSAAMGLDVLLDQRASLAGTSGRLLELGVFRAVWRVNRVALEIAGTPVRVFRDELVFAQPAQGAVPAPEGRRVDAGDFRLSTIVRLNGQGAPLQAGLRFGVRLPTTDETVGLERDQTDFFSTVAGRLRHGPLDLSGELGIGIYGSRVGIDQTDPVIFGLGASLDLGPVTPVLAATGQHDTRANGPRRGTEDLGELRLGVRAGTRRWLSVSAVRGWARFSPGFGVSVRFGSRF
jgi:hypothetical protein